MTRYIVAALAALGLVAALEVLGIQRHEGISTVQVPRSVAAMTATQKSLVRVAYHYGPGSGIRYVWGGTSPRGFDCSGYVYFVHGRAGIWIPRDSRSQWASSSGVRVARGQERPGDVVFFVGYLGGSNYGGAPGHVGMYVGHGKMIDYYSSGWPARIMSLSAHRGYMGAKRWYAPARVPKRYYADVVWLAQTFHAKISGSHGYTVVFEPRRPKLIRWLRARHFAVSGDATHTNVTMLRPPRSVMLELHNSARAQRGLSSLRESRALNAAARTKLAAIRYSGRFSHTPGGGEFTCPKSFSSCGENLARGYSTPASAFKAWMHSPGHRHNILTRGWRLYGSAYDAQRGLWAVEFGTLR